MSILFQHKNLNYRKEKSSSLAGFCPPGGWEETAPPQKKIIRYLHFLIHLAVTLKVREKLKWALDKLRHTPMTWPWRSPWGTFWRLLWHPDSASFSFSRHYVFLFWRGCVGDVSRQSVDQLWCRAKTGESSSLSRGEGEVQNFRKIFPPSKISLPLNQFIKKFWKKYSSPI